MCTQARSEIERCHREGSALQQTIADQSQQSQQVRPATIYRPQPTNAPGYVCARAWTSTNKPL
eukprot:1156749-Pelagomonas_calceolata.AAC.4